MEENPDIPPLSENVPPPLPPQNPTMRAILAGIGAVALACENAERTVDRLVDKGNRVRLDFRENVDDIRRQNTGTGDRVAGYVRSGMDSVFNKLNFPSKGDVDTINVKLNILSRKLDDIQMTQVQEATNPAVAEPPLAGDLAT